MEAHLQALEGKISEYGHFWLDLGAIISELASLNSNVRALTKAIISNLKHFRDNLQRESKLDADKTHVANTRTENTTHPPPPPPPPFNEPEGARNAFDITREYIPEIGARRL